MPVYWCWELHCPPASMEQIPPYHYLAVDVIGRTVI